MSRTWHCLTSSATHTHMYTHIFDPLKAYARLSGWAPKGKCYKAAESNFYFLLCGIIILHADKTLKAKAPKGITIKRTHTHTHTHGHKYLELAKRKLNWRKSFCALCSFVFLHFACQIKTLVESWGLPRLTLTHLPPTLPPPLLSFVFVYWQHNKIQQFVAATYCQAHWNVANPNALLRGTYARLRPG